MNNPGAISRRVIIGAALAVAALPIPAFALVPGQRFRAITFDNAPMAAKGGRALVELMRVSTLAALQKTFGDILSPGDRNAPVLRVILDTAGFGSPSGGNNGYSSSTDSIEGSGHVIGPRGENLGDFPILTSRSGSSRNRPRCKLFR